ncbi:MAG TPA: alpha/beta hydrolase [Candidatus Acidoferrales bacterium]|nr:alpha/beta hydrolase [Candidatus Acidoferrales bacterium]
MNQPTAGSGSLGLISRFVPAQATGLPALLLLHGTGGDESDLLPLGTELLPNAALISPRGAVLEGGMPRFFKRLSPGVFDLEDLALRSAQLAEFIVQARLQLHIVQPLVAVGLSNGANIAADLLLNHPGALDGAILFRALVAREPAADRAVAGVPVLIAAGSDDPIVSTAQVEQLERLLAAHGHRVEVHWSRAGHGLTRDDLASAQAWLRGLQWDLGSDG